MADITFFSLSNKVFEIKLIIMFQRRETLSYTLCGPTVPRAINKIQKNCPINMSWLIFFDILFCPSSCHNHRSWSTYCGASKRKRSDTHTHGHLEGNGRRIERRVLNCTCLHRVKHTVNETKDICWFHAFVYKITHSKAWHHSHIYLFSLPFSFSRAILF